MAEKNNNHIMDLDYMPDPQQDTAATKGGKMGGASHKSGKAGTRGSASLKKGGQRGRQSGM